MRLDFRRAQMATRIIQHRAHAVFLQSGGINFENEIRAPAKIEAQCDLFLGEPARHGIELRLGEGIGEREDDARKNDKNIGPENPSRSAHI